MEDRTVTGVQGVADKVPKITVVVLFLAFAFLFSGVISASETDSPRMLYDESGDLIGMQVDPAMARKEMSPDMLQSYGDPMEPVQTGQENMKVFSNEDDPIPMEPPFGPDVLVYTSGTADDTPRIAFNPTDGWLWTVFTHDNGVDDDIYVFYSDNTGVTWNPALQTTGAYNENNPAIAIAGNTIMIAYEQDNVGDEQHVFFIRSQDGGQSWGGFYMDWDWTNPDPPGTHLEDFNDPDISVVRPQWFHWTMSAWGSIDSTRTVAFMWTENDGDNWSMGYWNATWHLGEDFERPVIMENTADGYIHMAWQHENLTEGGFDVEWMIADHNLSDVSGWWTANLDDDNTELGPDIFVRDDYVLLVWQNGTVDPDLTAFYSDDGGGSLWILFITRQDGFGQMYPSVYIHDDYTPHISCVNDTSIMYLNNTNVLTQAFGQWKADDFPGNVVADFRATDILYAMNNPRIVFADARLGASDIWYTKLGPPPPRFWITRSPLIAQGDILVDGIPCPGTCGYDWILGSTHTLEAPTLMTDPLDPTNVRYRFSSWSDGGAQNHTYTVPSSFETLTAYYDPQYNITIATAPDPNLEIVVDATPYFAPQSFWWTLGESHNLEATTPQIDGTGRYVWQSWSDGGGRSHSVTITALATFTATFAVEYTVNITTNPAGLDVEVDGLVLTTPVSFWWLNGSTHDLYAISPQYVNQDERFRYVDWSDGEAIAHQIIVSGPETITAYYITQYNVSFTTFPPGLIVEVDGVEYTAPVSFFFDVGSVHTMHIPSPQVINPTTRFVFLSWNDGGFQTHDFTVTGPATYTANFGIELRMDVIANPPGLNITVDAVEHTAPYSFWCAQGSSVMLGAPSPQLVNPTMRYRWDSWSDMGTQSHPIICNMANTYTANFVAQYLLNVSTDPQGLLVEVDGFQWTAPLLAWYDSGAMVTLQALSPILIGDVRYIFIGWNDGGPQSHTITLTGPATYVAYYDTEYLVTITSTPVTGLSLGEIDGVPITTPYEFWCPEGSMLMIGVPSPQDGPVANSRWVWRSWSDGGAQDHIITCIGPETFTADFVLQHRLTISGPALTVIDFDSTPHDVPYLPWCDYLSVHNIGAPSPQDVLVGSSRLEWIAWSDGGARYHNITVTGADTYVASFKVQYRITITSDPAGLVEILADGVPQTTPFGVWWDESSSHSIGVNDPHIVAPGERYMWASWSDGGAQYHDIIVVMSQIFTATMDHEFQVTIDSTPVDGITVTVDGTRHATPQSFWWGADTPHSISGIDFQDISSGVRLAFASWSDLGARTHNIVADMPKTLTAEYTTRYYLTVEGCNPQGEGWYDSGTTATFSTTSPCPPGAPHTRYVFIAWTGDSWAATPIAQILMDGPKTVTATWATQYYLTVDSDYGTATGEDWYYSGDTAYARLDVDIYTVGTTQYVFAQWTGDASGTNYAQSSAVVMDAPMMVTAQWATQYFLTVTSAYGYPAGEGWYDSGTTAVFSVTTPYAGTTGTQYVFSAWSGDSTTEANPESVSMNGPMSVTAQWTTEYRLTVTSAHGNPQGAGWYSSGSQVTFSVTSPSAGATGVQYVLSAWTGDSTSTSASAWITMDAPKTATAQWTTQYYLTVSSDNGYPQGAGWHDAGTEARFSVTSPFTSGSVKYEFTSWSGDSSSKKTSDTILMNGPKTVVAQWQDSGFLAKFWWIFPIIIIIVTFVISALWMMRRKRPEQEELEPREKTETPPGEA